MAGVALTTLALLQLVPHNVTIVGFAYLLLVLVMASVWGFVEAVTASLLATLAFNFFFLPPLHTFTISDPQNWAALFSFLATSIIASRLSAKVRARAQEALARQQDVERLYTFSRAILLIEDSEAFPKLLAQKLADTFSLSAVVLYERRTGEFHRAGPWEFEGMDDQLKEAAAHGTTCSDTEGNRIITAVRLGSEPIASLALQGARMPDSVLQGVANLVAIGLERAKAQGLAHQVEVSRQSERLRTTLIDAMAHEFKTPLTLIKGATTSLLDKPEQPIEAKTELLKIADEEADHLSEFIDHAVELARLDTTQINVQLEEAGVDDAIREVVASMSAQIDNRPFEIVIEGVLPSIAFDRRLMKLAIKQLLDNALKYSPPDAPIGIRARRESGSVVIELTDHGEGIPAAELDRIFDRFYRSPSVHDRIPGSGLGLSIAHRIAQAHGGDLTVASRPGVTTFRLRLPIEFGEKPN